jgi:carbamate kinase
LATLDRFGRMLVVMAIDGNVLFRQGAPNYADALRRNVAVAARAIAAVAREHAVVVTYGNGRQVGLLAKQSEFYHAISPNPPDVLKAESEDMFGYLLGQALENEMPGREISSLVTEVIVRLEPVGPRYADTDDGRRFAAAFGWMVAHHGNGFRRLIPSPEPQRIVQLTTIKTLIEAGALVICIGGGVIPITEDESGLRKQADVIIDTDLVAALLAEQVEADLLMLLTDDEHVEVNWRTEDAPPVGAITVEDLRRAMSSFAPGLIGPKVEAACRFVESTGKRAAIGALSQVQEILPGTLGIQVTASGVS